MKLLRIHGHNSTLVNAAKYRPHCIKKSPETWQIGTLNLWSCLPSGLSALWRRVSGVQKCDYLWKFHLKGEPLCDAWTWLVFSSKLGPHLLFRVVSSGWLQWKKPSNFNENAPSCSRSPVCIINGFRTHIWRRCLNFRTMASNASKESLDSSLSALNLVTSSCKRGPLWL